MPHVSLSSVRQKSNPRRPAQGQLAFDFREEIDCIASQGGKTRLPRHEQTKTCEECGLVFQRGTRLTSDWKVMRFCCNSCGQKARRRLESRCPDEATLRRLYERERLTPKEIGKRFGVTTYPVTCWLKKYGIKARTFRENTLAARGIEPPDGETLRRLLYQEFKTYREVGEIYGVDRSMVPRWLAKHGVPKPTYWNSRNNGVEPVLPDAGTLRSLYADGHSLRQIAESYGVSDVVITRLCNEYGIKRKPGGFNNNGGQYYACDDGREVRSSYEMRVANWLSSHGIGYEYEPPLPFGTNYLGDFLANGWYIEVWGVAGNDTYEERKKRKTEGYHAAGLPLIELNHWHFAKRNAGTLEKRLSKCLVSPA